MNDDDVNAAVDPTGAVVLGQIGEHAPPSEVEGVRRDWVASLEMLARLCELYGPTVVPHDEALASSMEFVALRTRRVIKRVEEQS